MTLAQALNELLQNLSQALIQGDDKVNYSFADVQQWQAGVLSVLLDYQLIKPISAAQSIECSGCENNCFMDVVSHQIGEPTRSYIVCDDSEKQEQMGRVAVPQKQLKQWQVSVKNLALLLAQLLGFEDVIFDTNTLKKEFIPLGMLESSNGRKWANLHKKPLALDLNQVQIPISELLFVVNGKLAIDRPRIEAVLVVEQPIKAKDYQSNTDKREQRNANTQAMYKDWQDEYEKLKRENPNKPNQPKKTKGWYAYKISKMPIAQGGTVANITRVLKN
ncbi:hypothetical protein A9Q98_02985 [Thalassotalea sp. 42_200_T64]|nr:hypothetical protein A9Q98_02985 [Thalassotalea sp. 42_200_T64]